ncbi:MAG: efflux RND transporter permease subunit, partial [Myxococcales bacterium]
DLVLARAEGVGDVDHARKAYERLLHAVGGHLGEVTIELVSGDQRGISTREVAQRWRELVGPVAGSEELLFASSLFSAGEEINIQLQGPNVEQLEEAADRVKQALVGFPGVIDITDSFRAGKNEVKLAILPEAEALGLGLRDLARQVRQGFYGEEAQRVQRGRDDVRVMIRYPEADRRSLGDLEQMRLRPPEGGEVPFDAVARARVGRGYSTIRRADRERIVSVTADVDRSRTTGNEVLASMRAGPLPEILRDYPGVSYRLEGIQDEQARALGGLATAYPVALFAIYALLAIPLASYVQPLLIMSVIPFGMVGAIAGHVLTGQGLSFMSVQGMIALTGVVANSSLILVHSANERRAEGAGLRAAVIDSAVARFRPIVLTSLTTFAGLTPLLLERSVQAQFLIPMATSLAFGVIFATAIALVLLPCATLILEDLRSLPERMRAAGGLTALFRAAPDSRRS